MVKNNETQQKQQQQQHLVPVAGGGEHMAMRLSCVTQLKGRYALTAPLSSHTPGVSYVFTVKTTME